MLNTSIKVVPLRRDHEAALYQVAEMRCMLRCSGATCAAFG